jgi:ribosome-associated translation inhibitor RaiA
MKQQIIRLKELTPILKAEALKAYPKLEGYKDLSPDVTIFISKESSVFFSFSVQEIRINEFYNKIEIPIDTTEEDLDKAVDMAEDVINQLIRKNENTN